MLPLWGSIYAHCQKREDSSQNVLCDAEIRAYELGLADAAVVPTAWVRGEVKRDSRAF